MTTPSLARSLHGRALHLRIYPRPTTIAQSRAVLHYLSQFGDVEYYKNLKYDRRPSPSPTSALIIYRTPESAKECLRKDPIRFGIGRASPSPSSSSSHPSSQLPDLLDEDEEEHHHKPKGIRATDPLRPERKFHIPGLSSRTRERVAEDFHASEDEGCVFQINVRVARANFRDQVDQSHFHGGFEINTKTAAQQDLVKKVPLVGLSDLDWTVEKPWKAISWELKRDHEGERRRKPLSEIWEEGVNSQSQ